MKKYLTIIVLFLFTVNIVNFSTYQKASAADPISQELGDLNTIYSQIQQNPCSTNPLSSPARDCYSGGDNMVKYIASLDNYQKAKDAAESKLITCAQGKTCTEAEYNQAKTNLTNQVNNLNKLIEWGTPSRTYTVTAGNYSDYSQGGAAGICEPLFIQIEQQTNTISEIVNTNGASTRWKELDQLIKDLEQQIKKATDNHCDVYDSKRFTTLKDNARKVEQQYMDLNTEAAQIGVDIGGSGYTPSACENNCKQFMKTPFLQVGYCAAMCVVDEAFTTFITWAIKVLVSAAGVS